MRTNRDKFQTTQRPIQGQRLPGNGPVSGSRFEVYGNTVRESIPEPQKTESAPRFIPSRNFNPPIIQATGGAEERAPVKSLPTPKETDLKVYDGPDGTLPPGGPLSTGPMLNTRPPTQESPKQNNNTALIGFALGALGSLGVAVGAYVSKLSESLKRFVFGAASAAFIAFVVMWGGKALTADSGNASPTTELSFPMDGSGSN